MPSLPPPQVLNATISGGAHAGNYWSVVGTAGQLAQPVAVSRELFPAITAHGATLQLPLLGSAPRGAAAAAEASAAAEAAVEAAEAVAAAEAEEEEAAAAAAAAAAGDLAFSSMDSPAAAAAAAGTAPPAAAAPAAASPAASPSSTPGPSPSRSSPGRLRGLRRQVLPLLRRTRQARPRPDPVLTIRVAGSNLQYCHYISVRIFGQVYVPAGLAPAELARDDLTDPPPQHGFVPLRLVSHALHLARQAAGAAYQLARGSKGRLQMPQPEPSELLLRVPVPASVVARLRAAAASGAAAGQLVELVLRSDFQQVSVPVEVQGPRVALLGLRPDAAALVLAGLAGTLPLPQAAGQPRPLARWLPRPQWFSGLRRGAAQAGRAALARAAGAAQQDQQQQQQPAAVEAPAASSGPGPWGPVSAVAAAAAAAAALQGAPGVMAEPLLLPPPMAPGVIGRAAAASEGFVAATGRLVGLSRQLRLSGRGPSGQEELAGPPLDQVAGSRAVAAGSAGGGGAAEAAAAPEALGGAAAAKQAAAAAGEAQAAAAPAPQVVPNARLAVSGAVRKIIGLAKRKGGQQQQQEEEQPAQDAQQPVAAGGPSKRQRLLLAERGAEGAEGAAAGIDVYALGSSAPGQILAAGPGAAAAAAVEQGVVSGYSFTMKAAPPTAVQAADVAPAAAADAASSAAPASTSGWRFGGLLRMGSSPTALLPAGPGAASPAQQPPAAAEAPAAALAAARPPGGQLWSPEGVQLFDVSLEGQGWQQAALQLAQHLQQGGQHEPSGGAGWKALPGRVLQAAGAIAKGISSMSLQPVAEALLPGAQQEQQPQQGQGAQPQPPPQAPAALQQPAPQVLLLVADAADQQQLEQLQGSQELQQLLRALSAAGAAVLPVLLYDPDQDAAQQVQRAKQGLAAALETGPQSVQLLAVQRELLLVGAVAAMSEQQQQRLRDGLALLRQRLLQWLHQHGAQQAPAPQLQAKL